MNFRRTKTGQWYLIRSGNKGSATPLVRILFLLRTIIKSISEADVSVKCVLSVINCVRLNCKSRLLILFLLFRSML